MNKNSKEDAVLPPGVCHFCKQVKNSCGENHLTMIYRLWSQNDTIVLESLLGKKCMPGLMTVGYIINQERS